MAVPHYNFQTEECSVETENDAAVRRSNFPFLLRRIYNRRGIFLTLLAAAMLTTQNILTKFLHSDVNVLEITFVIVIMQTVCVIPFMIKKDISPKFESKQILILLSLRGFLGMTASCLFYFSILHMSIGNTTAIVFSSTVVTGILGRIFLKEAFDLFDALLVLVNICGVVLITKPSFIFKGNEEEDDVTNVYAPISAVGSCLCFSASFILCRKMGLLKVHSLVIVLYGSTVAALGIAVINTAVSGWTIPQCGTTRILLVLMGIIGFTSQFWY